MKIKRSVPFEQELNPQQLKVVKSDPGPALVIAGAGSGKTRTLTYRVAYLIESGIDPHKILLLTFTNKAAREMTGRVESLIPSDIKKIWGGTFHHIANRILRVHAQRLDLDPNYTILDQSDSQDLLDSCLEDLGHKKKDGMIPQGSVLFNMISLSRNTRTSLPDTVQQRYPFCLDYVDDIEKIEHHYNDKKHKLNLLDFDDLLCKWLSLMEDDQNLRDYYTRRFEHILVDEYQDTNRLQAEIIDTMASHWRNLMVVGDDSQSIYAFRGANFSNIMDFPSRYPGAQIYKLEYNYRSSPEILELANEIIVYNQRQFRKVLQPVKDKGVQPYLNVPADMYQQAQHVADKISEYVYNGVPPEEIAVLYRAHFHSMELQMELSRRTIPFEVRSGIRFFEQAHIKDITAYLKIIINPYDEVAWKRILQLLPGIGKKTSRKIFDYLAGTKDPIAACLEKPAESLVPKAARPYWNNFREAILLLPQGNRVISPAALIRTAFENWYMEFMRSKYTDSIGRSEDIERFIEFACKYESATDFLSDLALMTSSATDETQADISSEKVKLSTIHQAKGLEWSVVFIIGLVEGRFPNPNNFESLEDEEEERRLFYVAVTRAKENLYMYAPEWAQDRSGNSTPLKPSRFLRELPQACYKKIESLDGYGTY
jgi:DNA helicase-2/ATP-dependent DNA helicase PcrA